MHILKNLFSFANHHKILSGITIIIVVILIFVFRPNPSAPVSIQTVSRSHFVQSVSVSGTIQAKNSANLSFLIPGILVYIGVKKGDFVKQYQTIATLDQRTVQKNLQNTLLAYDVQRKTFDQTQQNGSNGELQHLQLANTTDSQIPKPDAINQAVERILQQNQDNLQTAVNSVELQSLAKEQTILMSPISGIITRADVTTINTNVTATNIYSVVDPNSVVFSMDVDESDIGKIINNQKAQVVLDAYPDTTLTLPVNSIDFVSHNTSTGGTAYTVEVKLPDNNDYRYKIGMSGNGEIITNEKNDVISIPINAIADNNYVYVQKTPTSFEKRKITLGLQNDTSAEVTGGLQTGEKIALDTTAAAKEAKQPSP